ncbi:MAG: hypothetical protein ABI398_14795 [Devosia sp.]
MADRETIIETTDDGGSSALLGILIGALIVVLLVVGGFLVFNYTGDSSNVTLEIPKVTITTPK